METPRMQDGNSGNSAGLESDPLLQDDGTVRPHRRYKAPSSIHDYGTYMGNSSNNRRNFRDSVKSNSSYRQSIWSGPTLAAFGRSLSFPNNHFNLSSIEQRLSGPGHLASRTASRLFRRRTIDYDDEFKDDMVNERNGIRVFYDSFTSIDWIHDFVKESVRLKKLRGLKGLSGRIMNIRDAATGWILAFLTGLLTSFIAAGIIMSEGFLFDLKEGYCSENWRLKKSFCCAGTENDECSDWLTWSEALENTNIDNYWINYIMYILFALLFALTSCALTLLTRSNLVYSKKSLFFSSASSTNQVLSAVSDPGKVMYFAAGSGIPEVKTILGGFVIRGFLGVRTLIVKSIGLTLSVASNLSLGKEGPFVHIACCVGNILCRLFDKYERNEGKRREILSAASAAGVAVAFGAPVGGVLFSLEEVSYYFPNKTMWRSFFCAMVAAASLRLINPYGTGKIVLFQVTYDKDWHFFEIIFFLFIGILGGVYGAVFSKLNILWARKIRSKHLFKRFPLVEVGVVTTLTVLLSFFNRFTKMAGSELVLALLSECRPEDYENPNTATGAVCVSRPNQIFGVVGSLAWALAIKAILTIVTFGIKIPAGIFIPSMCVGALTGRIVGLFVEWMAFRYPGSWFFSGCSTGPSGQCIIPGIYAMIGAASALAGVTRMTVSLTVIMFELTGTLSYVVPVMLSIMVSKWTADALELEGIYDLVIDLNDLPYLNNKREYTHTATVLDICDREGDISGAGECIHLDNPITVDDLSVMLELLVDSGYASDGGFPLIDKNGTMVGYIAASELEHALEKVMMEVSSEIQGPIFIKFRTGHENPSLFGTHNASDLEQSVDESLRPRSIASAMTESVTDFTPYTDQAPLSISCSSPMELVMELFVKLGCRYVCVVDPNQGGRYIGVIHKKRFLQYLKALERSKHAKNAL